MGTIGTWLANRVGGTSPGIKGAAAADPTREAARCDQSATSANGLVVDPHQGASEHVHTLLGESADAQAVRHWRLMGARDRGRDRGLPMT